MESINQDTASRALAQKQDGNEPPAAGASETGSQSQKPVVAENPEDLADLIEGDAKLVKQGSINSLILAVPGVRPAIVAAAVRCLGSARLMYDRDTKKVVTVADGTTIMKAVAWLSAYSDGLPVQQTLNVNFDANKEMPVKEMLVKSPALRAAFRKQLEEAEREAGDPVQKTGGQKRVGPPSETPAGG